MGSLDFPPISLVRHVWRNDTARSSFPRTCIDADMFTEGDFTLVVSAFSPTHLGEFSLLVCSSRWVEVDPIPQEGAGMFAKTMRGEWCVRALHSRSGRPGPVSDFLLSCRTISARPRYSLELPIPTDVKSVPTLIIPFLSHSHGVSFFVDPIRASLAEFACSPMHLLSCVSGCFP